MLDENTSARKTVRLRTRFTLKVVDAAEARGFIIPHQDGAASYRGCGSGDYACGGCGRLLAIGVRPGMFQSFVFACGCGALNQVQ